MKQVIKVNTRKLSLQAAAQPSKLISYEDEGRSEKVICEISILQRDGSTWPAGDSAPEDDEYDEFARGDDEDADIDDESAAIWTEPEGATADLHTI